MSEGVSMQEIFRILKYQDGLLIKVKGTLLIMGMFFLDKPGDLWKMTFGVKPRWIRRSSEDRIQP